MNATQTRAKLLDVKPTNYVPDTIELFDIRVRAPRPVISVRLMGEVEQQFSYIETATDAHVNIRLFAAAKGKPSQTVQVGDEHIQLYFRERSDIREVSNFGAATTGLGAQVAVSQTAKVGIAMATYEPDLRLFRNQVESIQDQSFSDWRCTISDDASSNVDEILAIVADDARFRVVSHQQRKGFYRNFERAIAATLDTEWIALSDQDDRWQRNKLERLLEASDHQVAVTSGVRVVDSDGQPLPGSGAGTRPTSRNPFETIVANANPGMTLLVSSTIARTALPFPQTTQGFHDHWLGLCIAAAGGLGIVPEALVDYTQHGQNALGSVTSIRPSKADLTMLIRHLGRLRKTQNAQYSKYRMPDLALAMLAVARFGETSPLSDAVRCLIGSATRQIAAQALLEYRGKSNSTNGGLLSLLGAKLEQRAITNHLKRATA